MFTMQSVVFYCAALITTVLIEGTAAWVVNIPGAPMFLEGQMDGAYTLKNTSLKKVASFTLGCVALKKRKVVVVSRLPQQKFPIVSGGSFSEAIVDSPYTPPYEECVVKQKAKLAVISVQFADNSEWNAP